MGNAPAADQEQSADFTGIGSKFSIKAQEIAAFARHQQAVVLLQNKGTAGNKGLVVAGYAADNQAGKVLAEGDHVFANELRVSA